MSRFFFNFSVSFKIWNQDGKWRDVEDVLRSAAYDRDIDELIEKCLYYVVSNPAVFQAAKGILTAGMSKTVKYSSAKVSKMLKSHDLTKSKENITKLK